MPQLGPTELVILLALFLLLFGARKLPELARGIGQALRIFKTETRGLSEAGTPTAPVVSPARVSDRAA